MNRKYINKKGYRMYKKFILFLTVPLMLSACSDNSKKAPETSDSGTLMSQSVNAATNTTTINSTAEPVTATKPYDERLELQNEMGDFTLQNPTSSWTEEDVSNAWNMLEISGIQKRYFDRLFCDLDNNGVDELILTANSTSVKMFIFSKNNNKITLKWAEEQSNYDFPYYDKDIGKGEVCTPITDKEILLQYIDEFDFYGILERDFKIINANGRHYMTGFVHNAYSTELPGNIFWIKEIGIENDELYINTLYRWGIFFEKEDDGFHNYLHFYKCNGENIAEHTEVSAEEIEKFLNNLK